MSNIKTLDKEKFRSVFYTNYVYQSDDIYGGVQGFYDYAPDGDRIMKNIINEWDLFFVRREKMLTIECPVITPEKVLKASGHVERFNDYLVKDMVTGESFRADHLIESFFETLIKDQSISPDKKKEYEDLLQKIDNFGENELADIITKFNIKSAALNDLSRPKPFNLMFETSIGPSGNLKGYLRPETAQGIFVNFKKLLEKKQGKLPFACAQIGMSCRNEISPRSGLLRVREFKMAEIEHFLDPIDKSHAKFKSVAHLNINMFTSPNQMNGKSVEIINLGEAVERKLIANETLGYFMGRIYMFLMKVGIKPELFRFRQHMPNEMAHYACDCWDAECLTSYGWIECVGCADRSAYDLQKHTEHSGVKLVAVRELEEPKKVKITSCKPNMGILGKAFNKNSKLLKEYFESLSGEQSNRLNDEVEKLKKKSISIENVEFEIVGDYFEIIEKEETVTVEEFVPNVIEPSFGLGRIFYCLMEQNFTQRENDANRTYFTIPAWVASFQFSILPISSKKEFRNLIGNIENTLDDLDILNFVDTSAASLGKRYARTDALGIPFGITIDFDSINIAPASVTIRERDSMQQVRVKVDSLARLARQLVNGELSWQNVLRTYPVFEGQQS